MAFPDERNPVVASLAPDTAASLETLYRRYSDWLARLLALRFRSSPVEIDDLVQETYIRASRYAPEASARHPKALLMRIAVNLARDHMRRNVVRGGLAVDASEVPEAEAACDPEQEYLFALKEAVLRLPPLYRDVFVLSRFTGLTYEEIAAHSGISVKTVEWRMSKALAMCAAWLRD
jgi:RNA polymerase sigma-70 factor (ECF subfamily)